MCELKATGLYTFKRLMLCEFPLITKTNNHVDNTPSSE